MKSLLHHHLRARALALTTVLALLAAPALRAGNTWTGGGGDDNWGTAGNWGGSAPGYGTLTFSGTLRTSNANNSITAMNQVNWTGTAAWTMTNSGGTVLSLFDNGGTQAKLEANTTGGVAINAPITFAANNGGPPNPFGEINAISSNISFTGGTLTVNGSSVNGIKFWGGTGRDVSFANTVSASGKYFATTGEGSITIASGAAVTVGDAYIMNGGTLNLSGGTLSTSAVRLGGDFGTTGNQNQTLGGTLALTPASGGLTFSGSVNSVAGNTSGSLSIDSKNTSGTNTLSGGLFLDSDLKVQQAAGGSLALTGSTLDLKNRILAFQGGGDFDVSGVLSNSTAGGRVTQNGTGLLRFGAANTYSGETDINAGSVRVDVAPTGAGTTGAYYVGNGGTPATGAKLLVGGGAGGTGGGITFGNAVNVNAGSGGNRTVGGTNTTGTNTFSGTVTVTDGNATLVAATGGTVAFSTVTAATLQTVGVGGGANGGTVQFGGGSDNVNLAATVNSGTLQLAKTSSGAVHAIGGSLTVNSGATAQLGGTGGDQIFNSASVTVNSGGVFDANDRTETIDNLSLAGTGIGSAGALVNGGATAAAVTASGAVTLASSTSIGVTNSAAALTLAGKVTGSGDLLKVGAGRLSLGASTSDYTGATTVSAGTLEVTANNALGATSSGTTVGSGGALRLNTVNYTAAEPLTINGTGPTGAGALTNLGATTFAGQVTVASDATIGTSGGIHNLTLTGGIVKNGTTLTVAGGGTLNVNTVGISGSAPNSDLVVNNSVLVLNAASTYNGPTTVTGAAGVIKLGADNVLPAAPHTAISVMTGGKLDLNGKSDTVASLSGDGTVTSSTAGTPTLTVGGSDGSGDFSGVIQNGGATSVSIAKTGAGTQVLQGANTYTGTTVVMNGTLQVGYASTGQSGAGDLTVNTTGTLAGTGTIMSNTILNGVLRPGDLAGSDLGILSFGGDLTLGSSHTSYFQIGDPSLVYDQVRNSTGASLLTVAGIIDLGSSFEGGYTPVDADLWILFDSWGTIDLSSFNVGTNLLLPDVSGYGLAWDKSNLGIDGSISLVSTAPEPSRAMLILGATLIGLARRRRSV